MLWPPRMEQPASCIFSAPPCRMCPQVVEVALRGVSQNGERRNGAPAHGVDVAQSIGRRKGAEGGGIVDDGREEIHGLHQGKLRRQLVHAGIVGSVKPDQHVFVGPTGHGSQNLVQNLWTELGRSTRGFDVRRKLLRLGVIHKLRSGQLRSGHLPPHACSAVICRRPLAAARLPESVICRQPLARRSSAAGHLLGGLLPASWRCGRSSDARLL